MTTLELMTGHPFLEGLPPAEVATLAGCAHARTLAAGTRIFGEGEEADRFWLLLSGHVQIDALIPGRGAVVVESLGSGTVLGWSWLNSPHVWHFGATAVEETRTLEFDAAQVRRALDDDPALGYALTRRFMRVVHDRLQATRVRLLDLYKSP